MASAGNPIDADVVRELLDTLRKQVNDQSLRVVADVADTDRFIERSDMMPPAARDKQHIAGVQLDYVFLGLLKQGEPRSVVAIDVDTARRRALIESIVGVHIFRVLR